MLASYSYAFESGQSPLGRIHGTNLYRGKKLDSKFLSKGRKSKIAEKGLYEVAMKDAREKAESIARASGRKLGKVLSVNDGGTANTYPVYARMDMVGAGGGAPLEPGSSTVYKSMTVSFELK